MAKLTRTTPHPSESQHLDWWPAGDVELALWESTILCRAKGTRRLIAMPKQARATPAFEQLQLQQQWLIQHQQNVARAVEHWMLHHVTVTRSQWQTLWEDAAWRRLLEHALIVPLEGERAALAEAGLPVAPLMVRALDTEGRVLLLSEEGTLAWAKPESFVLPHPVTLLHRERWQHWLQRLGLQQGLEQVERAGLDQAHQVGIGAGVLAYDTLQALVDAKGWQWQGGCVRAPVGIACEARWALVWVGPKEGREWQQGALSWVDAMGRPLSESELSAQARAEGRRLWALVAQTREEAQL